MGQLKRPGFLERFPQALFVLPVLVQAFICWYEWHTASVGFLLSPQSERTLLIGVTSGAVVALWLTMSCLGVFVDIKKIWLEMRTIAESPRSATP